MADDAVHLFWQVEEGEQEDDAEERAIRETDDHVGRIYSALLSDTLLMVCSCHGDTSSSRMLYVSLLEAHYHTISSSLWNQKTPMFAVLYQLAEPQGPSLMLDASIGLECPLLVEVNR